MAIPVLELSARQAYALLNPVDRSDGVLMASSPKHSAEIHVPWISSLEVTREPDGHWYWRAGVARVSSKAAIYPLAQWDPEWHDLARQLLDELLAGVGSEEVKVDDGAPQLGPIRHRRLSDDEAALARRRLRPPRRR